MPHKGRNQADFIFPGRLVTSTICTETFPADGGEICADLNKGGKSGQMGRKIRADFFPGRLVTTLALQQLFTTMASSPRVFLLAALAYLCANAADGFVPAPSFSPCGASCDVSTRTTAVAFRRLSPLHATFIVRDDSGDEDEGDDDDEEEDMETDPYVGKATSEFLDSEDDASGGSSSSSSLAPMGATSLDWGGALDTLRDRVDDIESGKSGPSNALFRLMSAETPNQAIGKFVEEADPSVIQAMTGAVSSLLGGLSNPSTGIEVVVKANGDKLGNLCFQLMMTGYLFRNAEYVLALKDLIGLRASASVAEYRKAFDKIDSDNSGYIEVNEIEALLSEVYGDSIPAYETKAFVDFFDVDNDGRISWNEFESGLGVRKSGTSMNGGGGQRALPGTSDNVNDDYDEYDEDEEDDEYPDFEQLFGQPSVEGKVQVELKNGKTIEVDAMHYLDTLKKEAEALKEALRMERGESKAPPGAGGAPPGGLVPGAPASSSDMGGMGIAGYIASLQGDVKSLTEGIAPETVETMKLLINFVLEGGGKKKRMDPDQEMELPGAALQQLALWQLVLGYRLRENEAKGEYKKLLE